MVVIHAYFNKDQVILQLQTLQSSTCLQRNFANHSTTNEKIFI